MLGFINMSPMHMAVILVVALLFFGNRLPEVARSIGRAINEFKRGMREVDDDARQDPPARQNRDQLSPPSDSEPVSSVKRDTESSRAADNEKTH